MSDKKITAEGVLSEIKESFDTKIACGLYNSGEFLAYWSGYIRACYKCEHITIRDAARVYFAVKKLAKKLHQQAKKSIIPVT